MTTPRNGSEPVLRASNRRSSRQARFQAAFVVVRDVVVSGVSVFGVLHQELSQARPRWELLTFYAVALGVVTVSNLIAIRRAEVAETAGERSSRGGSAAP